MGPSHHALRNVCGNAQSLRVSAPMPP